MIGLLLLATSSTGRCAGPPSLASSFAAFWSAANEQPFAAQLQQWDRDIEAPRRDIYAQVVWETQNHADWMARRRRYLQARFADYPALAAGIPGEIDALQQTLRETLTRFRQLFPDASMEPPVYDVLAPNFDAKSGVLADGTPVLVFAVDSLLLEKARLDIVVPHELFHLYHATHAGFRNDGVMPGVPLTLPLFEEGLATYVSGELSRGHSDGDLLLQQELGEIPASRLPDIARRFLGDARYKAIDPQHPDVFKRWFNASLTPYQKDLPDRTGYWLGLQVIRYLRRDHSLASIASWTPAQADEEVMSALQQLAASPASG